MPALDDRRGFFAELVGDGRPALALTGVALFLSGGAGFACAIGTHFVEGYVNPVHLAPAFAGAALFAGSLLCEMAGCRLWARRTSR